jgi:predicted RNA-binding protein Jag
LEKNIVVTGKTIDLAVETALAQLGLTRDDITYEVLALPKAGFLGIGAQPAKVQVTYEAPDPIPEAPKVALSSASRSKPKPTPAKKPEAPKAETPKTEQPKQEAPKAEPVKSEAPKTETPKAPKENKPKAPKENTPKAPKEGTEAAPKAEGEAKKPHRRRPSYRRKPNKPKQNPDG